MPSQLPVVRRFGGTVNSTRPTSDGERGSRSEWHPARDADVTYARRPKDLRDDEHQRLEFSLPTDRQWRRIVERLDAPVLLVVVATEPGTLHPHVYSAIEAGLTIGASQNGEALALTETKELPYNYWSTQQTAYKFIAAPGPPVQVKVRRTAESGAASDAFVMVFPHWSSLEMWHWGDSLSMGEGFSALFALLLFVPGVALIFVAVVLALLPLRPTR